MGMSKKYSNSLPKDPGSCQHTTKKSVGGLLNSYRVNLLLFVILVIVLISWFYLHIRPYVTQILFVGVPLTLWTFWKLVLSAIPKRVIGGKDSIAESMLGSFWATEYLILALGVITVFFFMTSSVYIEYQNTVGGLNEYEVEVEHKGQPYLTSITVSSYDRITGGPSFFCLSRLWEPLKLKFKIVKPSYGYGYNERTLWPWSRVYLRVPLDFPEKHYRIIRLIPGPALLHCPQRVDASDKSPYLLVIRFNKKECKVEDVLLETIYLGAVKDAIQSAIDAEPREDRYNAIRNYLTQIGWEKDPDRVARSLTSSYRPCPTDELQADQELQIELKQQGENNVWEILVETSYLVRDVPGIQNIYIQ